MPIQSWDPRLPADDLATTEVVSLLYMRFGVPPEIGSLITADWLQDNPGQTSLSLGQHLMENKIVVKDGTLTDLRTISPERVGHLVATLRGPDGVEIKDRTYRARSYPKCFVGCEAVASLRQSYGASTAEAIRLGQLLIEHNVIHHVLDRHDFLDEFFFYRFYDDEAD